MHSNSIDIHPMPIMMRAQALVKTYPRKNGTIKRAVDGLSFTVAKGETFALLGPNGAGKTTTIHMMTLMERPNAGEIFYQEQQAQAGDLSLRGLIGVVPQQVNFDQDLTVGENLELHARLYHLPKHERQQRTAELLAYVHLEDVRQENVRRLSGGMKRRLLIARALMHRPQVLFMDEPTVALDPQVRRKIWGLIRQLTAEGVTVFLTTHYIEEAENLAQHVAILRAGKLVALGTPTALTERLGLYVVAWEDKTRAFKQREEAAVFMQNLPKDAILRRASLEDAFLALTGEED